MIPTTVYGLLYKVPGAVAKKCCAVNVSAHRAVTTTDMIYSEYISTGTRS